MRWPCALAVLSACGGKALPPVAGGVSLVLDIPNGPLDPKGFASVEVILHEPSRDVTLSTALLPDGTFDLGAVDPSNSVSVEATLRNDSGAAVGYGRTATTAAFAGGSEVVVPVRRPIAYIAYAEDALAWHHDRHGASGEQRARDQERLREWRSDRGLDLHAVIRRIRIEEGDL